MKSVLYFDMRKSEDFKEKGEQAMKSGLIGVRNKLPVFIHRML